MATHSSILAWRIPWTEEPGRLLSMGVTRVGHNLATKPPPPPWIKHYFMNTVIRGENTVSHMSDNQNEHIICELFRNDYDKWIIEITHKGPPWCPLVKNSPADARDTDSIPGQGEFHMSQSNWVLMPQLPSPHILESVLFNKRSYCSEKPVHHNKG